MPKRTFGFFLLGAGIGAATLWYIIALIQDRPRWLRGEFWQWGRFTPELTPGRVALLLGLAVIWLGVVYLALRPQTVWTRRRVGLLLLWAVLFTPATQLVIAAQHRVQPLSVAFLTTTLPKLGFYYDGVRLDDPNDYVRQHVAQMPSYLGVHQRTQPFGWSLAFWAARHVWERFPAAADKVGQWLLRYDCTAYNFHDMSRAQVASAALQMSLVFWSGLGALPLFWLARRFLSPPADRLALAAYPLLPGLLVFQAYVDVLYALVTLAALWLGFRALWGRRLWGSVAALAGLFAGISLFSIGALMGILLLNVLLILYILLQSRAWDTVRRWVAINAGIGGGLILLWTTIWLVWGVSGLDILTTGRTIHQQIRITYPVWPLFNLYDTGVFMGLPWLLWAFVGGVWAVWRLRRGQIQRGDVWALGWCLFILLLNFSGEVQAETGRLWLFLAAPGMMAGVYALTQASGARRWPIYLTFALFAAQALVAGFYLAGPPRGAAAPERQVRLPAGHTPVDYRLGEDIALAGYTATRRADGVALNLYWRSLGWVYDDQLVFAHLVDADGVTVSQSDGAPDAGKLPTWCWTPGEIITDSRFLPLAGAVQEPLHLAVGLYSWPSGSRLPVTPPVANDAIILPVPELP